MIPGWTVARAIPAELLVGLVAGQYKLHGGVIRWAAGTSRGGQIVRHLIPVGTNLFNTVPGLNFIPGIIGNLQLNDLRRIAETNTQQLIQLSGQVSSLSQVTQQVLQISNSTAILSGLGLTAIVISFAAINHKLNRIETQLRKIQQDIHEIKSFLESSERARLSSALNELLKIDAKSASDHYQTVLHHSRNTLSEINMRYRELLAASNTIETAIANEEYFSLTALAQARCTAELGMLDIAHKEICEMNKIWQNQAQRISKEILIGEYPERFLATDFADVVSVAELSQWMDFIHTEKKGLASIDELRIKMNETWYSQSWLPNLGNLGSGLSRNVGRGLEQEKQIVIPALRKFLARSAVFEGYVAQYKLLEKQKLRPSEFKHRLAKLPESAAINGYLVLEPESASESKARPWWEL